MKEYNCIKETNYLPGYSQVFETDDFDNKKALRTNEAYLHNSSQDALRRGATLEASCLMTVFDCSPNIRRAIGSVQVVQYKVLVPTLTVLLREWIRTRPYRSLRWKCIFAVHPKPLHIFKEMDVKEVRARDSAYPMTSAQSWSKRLEKAAGSISSLSKLSILLWCERFLWPRSSNIFWRGYRRTPVQM